MKRLKQRKNEWISRRGLVSVEDVEAGLLAGFEHVFQDECNVESRGFVEEEGRFPGEGFVAGLYA